MAPGRATKGSRIRGRIEKEYREAGKACAGVDEVGRGCIAGPVTAGCVVLDLDKVAKLASKDRLMLRDSKLLTRQQRQHMVPIIKDVALDWQVAWASVGEIERIGILQACFLAMRRALAACKAPFDVLLIDGKLPLAGYDGEQRAIVKGDNLCYSIAAGAILAKEARDDFMRAQATVYPAFGFDEHVGYGTSDHLARIAAHGVCALHRRTFEPVRVHVQPVQAFGELG